MNGWKGVRLGRLGICCVKKKMFFGKYILLFDTSFFVCLFNFYFFLPSQTWILGFRFSRLQKILCLVFCLLRSFLFFSPFVHIYFLPSPPNFGFFPKSPILEFACWDSLDSFPSLFCSCFYFLLFIFVVTAFCSKFSFIKGEPAQLRFHSSELSVSIMHSSLLS